MEVYQAKNEPDGRIASAPHLVNALKHFSLLAVFGILASALLVLLGWHFDVVLLKSILPNVVSMNPMTACAFILAALALFCLYPEPSPQNSTRHRIGKALALLVALFGLFRLLGYFFNFEIVIDKMLFREKLFNNQIDPNTALNLFAIGLALYWTDFETRRKWRPGQLLALFVALNSLLAFLGYTYEVKIFYGVASLLPMALNTTILFILLALAVLSLRPGRGITEVIVSDSVGGMLGRRLLPASIAVPAFLGMLGLYGERAGFYDKEFQSAIVISTNIFIFSILVWLLAHALYAIDVKRKQAEEIVRQMSLTDELTGLYNRRGFHTLAEQQLKIAQREKSGFLVLFADVDGLKEINDHFGHREGDKLLVRVSEILRKSCRRSDIIARFAGDEYAILALDTDHDNGNILTKRLANEMKDFNERSKLPYRISFSFGMSYFDHGNVSIDELMAQADEKLYEIKRNKKAHPHS